MSDAALERPAARQVRIAVEIAVVLAPELDLIAGRAVRERVGALFELLVPSGAGRKVEGRRPAPDDRGAGDIGVDVAGVTPISRCRNVSIDAGFRRQDDIQDLALAGIVGAVKVARAEFDADDPLGRDTGEHDLERFRLRRRPGSVENDIACGSGEAPHVDLPEIGLRASEIELEARHPTGDVERRARSILREIGRIIGRDPGWRACGGSGRGLRVARTGRLRQGHIRAGQRRRCKTSEQYGSRHSYPPVF